MSRRAATARIVDGTAEEIGAPSSSIIQIVGTTPEVVFADPAKAEELFAAMKAEISAHVPDLSTKASRAVTISLASKITRTKTAIFDAGLKLTEELRERVKTVNGQRDEICDRLDQLAADVRRPVTEWKNAEDQRIKTVSEALAQLRAAAIVPIGADLALVASRLESELLSRSFDGDIFQDEASEADRLQTVAVSALQAAKIRIEKEEADRAELERLRKETAENDYARQILDHIREVRFGTIGGSLYPYQVLLRELEEKIDFAGVAQRHHAEIERARVEAHAYVTKSMQEQAERDREREAVNLRQQAEEEARVAVERQAREEREATERRHQEELAAERRKAEEAERAQREAEAKTERERQEASAVAEQQRREDERRTADREHRSRIMSAAKLSIMDAAEIDEETAKLVVLAIVNGNIPNVSINF